MIIDIGNGKYCQYHHWEECLTVDAIYCTVADGSKNKVESKTGVGPFFDPFGDLWDD